MSPQKAVPVLRRHGRRVVRVHLKADAQAGLAALAAALDALASQVRP